MIIFCGHQETNLPNFLGVSHVSILYSDISMLNDPKKKYRNSILEMPRLSSIMFSSRKKPSQKILFVNVMTFCRLVGENILT